MKLIPNPTFDPHDEASATRDNINLSGGKKSNSNNQQIFAMQISKEALQDDDSPDDSLTEEDLKVIIIFLITSLQLDITMSHTGPLMFVS
jgi:hypothetical protein